MPMIEAMVKITNWVRTKRVSIYRPPVHPVGARIATGDGGARGGSAAAAGGTARRSRSASGQAGSATAATAAGGGLNGAFSGS